ncbi:penicillin-binding protein 2 [Phormidesmis priestleyi ULC007]|uniref:Penicillin-binding protein 2 n=1 Tax=Phormidesmis priestleyi ULC007 TaxID=1920490 RepID=A0A2T1DIE3_9CYAN|nr:penicillin-binding protein 2 [Phormidesmis priestleyi]PSB20279.1 penicillin-binding protein 2 [Phormidesmis priestleyi ULC007]PZO50148.1 MAG: penicillin-binding protein 2 [Phormidesmis priestleyi]
MASGFSFVSTSSRVNQTRSRRSHRSVFLFMVATTLISGCMFRLAQLQIVQGHHNRQLADQNRIRPLVIVADRGNILDRKGVPLAANQLSRSIYLYPREQSMQQWQETAVRLSKILDIPAEDILKKLKQVGYRSAIPARVYRNLTPQQFVALAEVGQIPGLEIQAESSRHYPNGNIAAHILGYIGEATADDLRANPDFPMGMLLGQMGIERIADPSLRGKWGSHLLEVDSVGKELRMLGEQKPVSGSDLRLTIDLKLQQAAEKALNNQRGAVVALDVKTGAVLVMASGPTFDPNLFTRKISTQEWKDLQGQDHPFLNRSLQGYPPGSTFKIVTTSAGIQSGKFSSTSTLPTFGAINIGGTLFHEHGGSGYGTIGFRDALAFSSNTFFYQVGMAVGPDEISKWGHRLGIGETSSMGLEGGSHGVIPTPEQKQKLYGEPWYGGDTVSMAIGQGVVQVTPLELAVMVSAIANGGYRVKPHLMSDQTNTPAAQREATGLNPDTIEVIRAGLAAVVKEGTARRLSDGSIPPTAGKTGTAEVIGQRDNALYVGYGPLNDPQIAVAVVVENGGFGAESAVPIAHEIYKAYFGTPKSAPPIK